MSNASPLLDPAVVRRVVADLSARDNWARSVLLDVQRKRLDGLLAHAIAESSYYCYTIGPAVRR
jgi:hypothetical protein